MKLKVIDEVENKEIKFDNAKECCEFLNLRRANIAAYIKQNILFRKRYRIKALEPLVTVESKAVIVTDTFKNETIKFRSIKKACEHLEAKRDNVNKAIAAKRLFRKRYMIEYILENK